MPNLTRDNELAGAGRQAVVTRILSEISFARKLAELEKIDWKELIDLAEGIVKESLDGSLEDLKNAVAKAEGLMAPIAPKAKAYTIYCVGHGHIDMNWMWGWPETVATTNDTFLTVLKLMDEFPQLTYTQSQASVYEIARSHNPELFEAIKQKVKEGRWEVVASHWVEGDKNIASGEALARHLLYTRRFFKQHFGLEPEDVLVDWSPDTFGHAWTLPSIDARGAVKRYYLCRGGDTPTKSIFWWEGPDGGRVLVDREKLWYNSELKPESALLSLDFYEETGLKDRMQVYGVGDHGGGPTRRDIRYAIEMDTWPIFPNFKFSTSDEYFSLLEASPVEFPVVRHEMNFEFSGCYTSQSDIKRNNRLGEILAGEADTAAALAFAALGRPYPSEVLRDAWVDVLFSHFHDILPGSCVPDTRTFNQGTFQRVAAATGMIKTNSLRALAAAVDTGFAGKPDDCCVCPVDTANGFGGGPGRGTMGGDISSATLVVDGPRPFVIFNPTSWKRDEVVKVSVWDAQTGICPGPLEKKTFVVKSPDGKVIPAQRTDFGEYWGHRYADLVFPVSVGPLAYTTYSIEEGEAEEPKSQVTLTMDAEGKDRINLPAGSVTMENEYIKVSFDKLSGGIKSLVDKRTGRDVADPDNPMGILEFVQERPQGGSAWVTGTPAKCVCPLELTGFGAGEIGGWSTRIEDQKPYVATVRANGHVSNSTFTVLYQLKAGQPWLEITVEVRWFERGSHETGIPRLAIRFPMGFTGESALYEIPYGTLERKAMNGREVPSLRWADVRTKDGCLAVLNDSRYSHSYDGRTLRVALLRSTYSPDPLPEIGDHRIRFAIAPHSEDVTTADLIRAGAAFNQPLQVVSTDVHAGKLPSVLEDGVSCAESNVIVTQLKRAEDSDELVFRLQETAGTTTTAHVTLSEALFGKVSAAVEADLIERALPESSAALSGNGFSVKVDGFGIVTVKVTSVT